jgi:hypothetical protein
MHNHVKKWLISLLLCIPIFSVIAEESNEYNHAVIPTSLLTAPIGEQESFLEIAEILLAEAALPLEEREPVKRCVEVLKREVSTIDAQAVADALYVMQSVTTRAPREQGPNPVVGSCSSGCDFSRFQATLNHMQDMIESCCAVWTALAVDIITTLTVCCPELQLQFDALLEAIATLSLAPVIEPSFVDTITDCCTQIQSNFQGTWTTLNLDIEHLCASTEILAPTTITQAGIYCLGANIDGGIVIDGDNVVLDLNGYSISNQLGVAIAISAGSTNIQVKNGVINNAALTGVVVGTGCARISISDLMIGDIGERALLVQSSEQIEVMNILVQNMQQGLIFADVQNVAVTNCVVNDLLGTTTSAAAFVCQDGCMNIEFYACRATQDIIGIGQPAYGFLIEDSTQVLLRNCSVFSLASDITTRGGYGFAAFNSDSISTVACSAGEIATNSGASVAYLVSGCSDCIYDRCTISQINAGTLVVPIAAAGFFAEDSDSVSYLNCIVGSIVTALSEGCGFGISNTDTVTYKNCSVQVATGINMQYGFYVAPSSTTYCSGVTYDNCIALTIEGYGFNLLQGSGLLNECLALDCTLGGFRTDNTLGTPDGRWGINQCIASNNLGDGFMHQGTQPPAAFNNFANFNTNNFTGVVPVFNQGDQFNCDTLTGGIPAAGNISG